MSTLGSKIKSVRKKRDITQDQLAQLTNMHKTHINRYENDKAVPSATNLASIAKALQTSTDYLLFGDKTNNKEPVINNPVLLEKFKLLDKMDKKQQEAVITLIDAVIVKGQVERAVKVHG